MVTRVRPQHVAGRPRVSVVIPCYNYGHFLSTCVDSVLNQADVQVDVLIIDDASPDGSSDVAHEIAARRPEVRVIAHETNRRHIATYNEGLAQVDGEFVVLLSADDLLTPGSLARSAALLQAHPEVGMVYGFSPGFATSPPPPRTEVRSWSIWSGPEWVEQMCRRVSNPVSTPEVVLRTSLMRELVGYDARVPHAADFLLWLRAAARGRVGRVNGADQAYYRKHGANMHVELYAGVHTDIVERLKTFEILFTEDATHLPDGDRLHLVARQALAREALATVCQSYELGRENEPRERLLELAREICPPGSHPALWRAYESQLARVERGQAPLVPRRLSVLKDDLTGKVRWRRWRRSGLMGAVRSL